MYMMLNGTKIPHTLRLIIFFLRLAIGLDFFYLGFTSIFNTPLAQRLSSRSLSILYQWLASTANTGSFATFLEWAFLFIGICLVLGFATRFASIAGVVLVLMGFIPNINSPIFNASQYAN